MLVIIAVQYQAECAKIQSIVVPPHLRLVPPYSFTLATALTVRKLHLFETLQKVAPQVPDAIAQVLVRDSYRTWWRAAWGQKRVMWPA